MIVTETSSAFEVNGQSGFSYSRSYPLGGPSPLVRESSRSYRSRKRGPGPEAILHKAWRNAGLERARVRGRDGHTYKIIYGGKPGGSLGPDFTDAVVERDDGTVYRGDIEIHVRESDWRAHGHHTDRRYNGVVLHVVATDSRDQPALKATGSTIPLLALNWEKSRSISSEDDPSGDPEPQHQKPREFFRQRLDLSAAGLERFHSQAAGIALDIDAFGTDQAIWMGLLGALGYPRNKRAFRTLASKVDWAMASACESPAVLEELLIRAAGLEEQDSETRGRRGVPDGKFPTWVRPWGRPANAPQTRIRSISHLVPVWRAAGGISKVWADAVQRASHPSELARVIRPVDLVENDSVTVIGSTRTSEIIVNVLLPAVFALATKVSPESHGAAQLRNQSIELFSTHPKLAENSVTREAKIALAIDYEVPTISNARDQQGLITLYREMFRQGVRTRQPRLPGV